MDNNNTLTVDEATNELAYNLATELRYMKPRAHGRKVRQVMKYFKNLQAMKCLDVGCGTGFFTNELTAGGADAIGIDSSKWAIDFAQQRFKNVNFRLGSAYELASFESESFDLVLCVSVVEHLDNQDVLLKSINNLLKKGGRLIISTDLVGGPWQVNRILSGLVRRTRHWSKEGAAFEYLLKAKAFLPGFAHSSTPHINLIDYMKFKTLVESNGFIVLAHDVFPLYGHRLLELLSSVLPVTWRGDYQCIYATKVA